MVAVSKKSDGDHSCVTDAIWRVVFVPIEPGYVISDASIYRMGPKQSQ